MWNWYEKGELVKFFQNKFPRSNTQQNDDLGLFHACYNVHWHWRVFFPADCFQCHVCCCFVCLVTFSPLRGERAWKWDVRVVLTVAIALHQNESCWWSSREGVFRDAMDLTNTIWAVKILAKLLDAGDHTTHGLDISPVSELPLRPPYAGRKNGEFWDRTM